MPLGVLAVNASSAICVFMLLHTPAGCWRMWLIVGEGLSPCYIGVTAPTISTTAGASLRTSWQRRVLSKPAHRTEKSGEEEEEIMMPYPLASLDMIFWRLGFCHSTHCSCRSTHTAHM